MVNENNLTTKQEVNEVVDNEKKEQEKAEELSFGELYEQSLQDLSVGNIVTGKVVQITNDIVMVDVGYKTEGWLNINQFKDEEGNLTVSVGDEIKVFVDRKREDGLILSREKAVKMKVWDDVIKAHKEEGKIRGTIVKRVKGGLSVDVGIPAFLPGSQIDIYPVKDFDQYVGQTTDFNVLKYDRKRNNIVLSIKTILEKEKEKNKQKVLETMEEGKVFEGVVKNITDYGLFIDLGGIDGLLHITDMSWGRIKHPSDEYSRDDKITVKVLSFDREKERVSLGIKQLTENPWNVVSEKYTVGSIVEGKVVGLKEYGAFVEIEPGLEGLIHISEIFWTKKVKHPSHVLTVGDTVKTMILDVDSENRKISLGLKQTMPNPWLSLKEKYSIGSTVQGKIKNITSFGIFVGIEDEIDGLVHVSDISWEKRVKHPSDIYKKGQEIEAVVLDIDAENEKFSLGIKQLEKNPWEDLSSKYAIGSIVSGKITNVTDFGIFVEIEEGLEGLVYISELTQKKDKPFNEIYSNGDIVSAVIKNIDAKKQKIGLSIKDYESASEKLSMKQYVNNREKVVSNLGDILSNIKV